MSRFSSSSDSSPLSVLALIVLTIFGFIPGVFLLLGISSILNGWVLSTLWKWFISPVFGIPAITVGQAIGLAMVVSYLTYQYIDNNSERNEKTGYYVGLVVTLLLRPLVTLGIGYIVHLFV